MHSVLRWSVILLAVLTFGNSISQGAPVAAFRIRTEDMAGNPISTIGVGQDFKIAAYVEDIREPADPLPGVWAAYMNVSYTAGRVTIDAHPNNNPSQGNFADTGIVWADYFAHGLLLGDLTTPGLMKEVGSASLALTVPG